MTPPLPTATQKAPKQLTPFRAFAVPLVCAVQVLPPLVVARIYAITTTSHLAEVTQEIAAANARAARLSDPTSDDETRRVSAFNVGGEIRAVERDRVVAIRRDCEWTAVRCLRPAIYLVNRAGYAAAW